MSAFVLLTASDCHLCAHGREALAELADRGLLSWRQVDSDSAEGQRLAVAAPPLRPVLFDDAGHVVAYGRLSARRLRRQLGAAGSGTLALS